MDLRNSNGFQTLTLQSYGSFSKIFIRIGKMHHVELNSGTSKSSKQKIVLYVEDNDL